MKCTSWRYCQTKGIQKKTEKELLNHTLCSLSLGCETNAVHVRQAQAAQELFASSTLG